VKDVWQEAIDVLQSNGGDVKVGDTMARIIMFDDMLLQCLSGEGCVARAVDVLQSNGGDVTVGAKKPLDNVSGLVHVLLMLQTVSVHWGVVWWRMCGRRRSVHCRSTESLSLVTAAAAFCWASCKKRHPISSILQEPLAQKSTKHVV
jgi:hypothetical protein